MLKKKLPTRLSDIISKINSYSKSDHDQSIIATLRLFSNDLAANKGAVLLRMLNENPSELIDVLDFMSKNNIEIHTYPPFDLVWFKKYHENLPNLQPEEKELYNKMKNSTFFKIYNDNLSFKVIGNHSAYPSHWKDLFMSDAHKLLEELRAITPNNLKVATFASNLDNDILINILEKSTNVHLFDDGAKIFFDLMLSRTETEQQRINIFKYLNNSRFDASILNYVEKHDVSIKEMLSLPLHALATKKFCNLITNRFPNELEKILNQISDNQKELNSNYTDLLQIVYSNLLNRIDLEKLSPRFRTDLFHFMVDGCDRYDDESIKCCELLELNLQTNELSRMFPTTYSGKNIITICSNSTLDKILEIPKLIEIAGEFSQSRLKEIAGNMSKRYIDVNFNRLTNFVQNANLHNVFKVLHNSYAENSSLRHYESEPIHKKSELFDLFRNRLSNLDVTEIKKFMERQLNTHDSHLNEVIDIEMMLDCFDKKVSKAFCEVICNRVKEKHYDALYSFDSVMVLNHLYPNIIDDFQKSKLLNFAFENADSKINGVSNFIAKSYMEKSGESQEIQDKFVISTNKEYKTFLVKQKYLKVEEIEIEETVRT